MKPTQNIWAIGRNYADHAKEMNAPLPKTPLIFLKAGSCITTTPNISLPKWAQEIHYELEFALRLNENLEFSHWTLALDLTERAQQSIAKEKGTPWTLSKSFTGACPLGSWQTFETFEKLEDEELLLKINSEIRQKIQLKEMLFKPKTILAYLKEHYPMVAGDVVLTGTPAGVGALKSKDELVGSLGKIFSTTWKVQE